MHSPSVFTDPVSRQLQICDTGQQKGTKWAQTTPNHKTVNILGSAK